MNKCWNGLLTLVLCLCFIGVVHGAPAFRLTNNVGSSTDPYACSLRDGTGDISIVWIDLMSGPMNSLTWSSRRGCFA